MMKFFQSFLRTIEFYGMIMLKLLKNESVSNTDALNRIKLGNALLSGAPASDPLLGV